MTTRTVLYRVRTPVGNYLAVEKLLAWGTGTYLATPEISQREGAYEKPTEITFYGTYVVEWMHPPRSIEVRD